MNSGRSSGGAEAGQGVLGPIGRHAAERPEAVAFRFLDRHGASAELLTWEEIERSASGLGAHLTALGLNGQRVGIICPQPRQFVLALVGCLAAGAVAVPLPAITNRRSAHRIETIIAAARPAAIISATEMLAQPWVAELIKTAGVNAVDIMAVPAGAGVFFRPAADDGAPALIQFTSGSTGTPRGIELTHGNILANCAAIADAYDLDANAECLSWLPLHHDMGLIGHVLAPLCVGCGSSLMSPLHFLQSPLRWLRSIGMHRAKITSAPNFAYELCVKAARQLGIAGIDLTSLTIAICGGEPVWPDTIDRFSETFAPVGFKAAAFAPSYGMAEATLLIATGWRHNGPRVFAGEVRDPESGPREIRSVAHGRPVKGIHVRVLDAARADCPERAVGEIEVSGTSVGRPFGPIRHDFGDGVVRTGDLGFLADGELYVTGRRRELIIVRGQNIYPADIEAAALSADPAIQPGGVAAVGVLDGGTEALFIIFEISAASSEEAIQMLSRRVTEVVIQTTGHTPKASVAVRIGALPRTTSGKIQRGRIAELLFSGSLLPLTVTPGFVPAAGKLT